MHLTCPIPSLPHPLFSKVIVINKLESFEVVLHVLGHNLGIIAFQLLRDLREVVPIHTDRQIQHIALLWKGDTLGLGQAGGEQVKRRRIDRLGSFDVDGLKFREDVPNVKLEIAVLVHDRIPDAGSDAVAPDEQIVAEVPLIGAIRAA